MCRFRSMQKCKRAEWHGSPINFWCSPVLSLHPLMQNERMWHGNAYGKGRVLGVQPRRCICTNASRGLSATAEFFCFHLRENVDSLFQHYRPSRHMHHFWSDAVAWTGHATFQNVAPTLFVRGQWHSDALNTRGRASVHPNFRDPTRFEVECQYCIERNVAYISSNFPPFEPSRRYNF